ncbi:DUF4862 family protein [Nocardioides sp.]|uniref:DUF4862 family protein n=1 Tax=Nocardioides sp. TaxID=35761 RepID=UPI0026369319|nr:DUF4862 family protein [Nocardioides sp.]
MPDFIISSYAVSPAHSSWDPALEAELLPALAALPDVVGLEVPWLGRLHPHDDSWFLDHVPATGLALTPLPFVMGRTAADPRYGIASADAEGRAAALADLRALAADVARLAQESAATPTLIELHTAPRGGGSVEALAATLTEISGWDWSGARLVVEHCDSPVPGQEYEKGFPSVADELAALDRIAQAAGPEVGLWLNWGRSAVELRDADAVTAQIAQVADAGRLVGLGFSGAAAVAGPYGAAWADAHLPIASTHPESGSILDEAHVAAALAAAGTPAFLGVKTSRRSTDTTAADALATVAANLDVVRAAL